MTYKDNLITFEDGTRIYLTDLKFFEKTTRRDYHLSIIRMIKIQRILESMDEKGLT